MKIGVWVRRRRGKWHIVESVVADDAVTRCGRRMDRWSVGALDGELHISEVMPLTRLPEQPQLCRAGCQRGEPAEVDGSTSNETADA